MQCNQHFFGNGLGPQYYGSNPFNSPPPGNSLQPNVVGEGQLTSFTLPDGTVQFFFTPTVKWWSPRAPDVYPHYVDVNHNTPWNPNIGAWFVRSINNTATPLPSPTYIRPEPLKPYISDLNLNVPNNGYQLKFHGDMRTSTTDIHHFSPKFLQLRDASIHDIVKHDRLPPKECAAIQVDTVYHYDVLCGKQCNCPPQPRTTINLAKPPSAMSLENTKTQTDTECRKPSLMNIEKATAEPVQKCCPCDKQLYLGPRDPKRRRIKIEKTRGRAAKSKSHETLCKCRPPPSCDKAIDSSVGRSDKCCEHNVIPKKEDKFCEIHVVPNRKDKCCENNNIIPKKENKFCEHNVPSSREDKCGKDSVIPKKEDKCCENNVLPNTEDKCCENNVIPSKQDKCCENDDNSKNPGTCLQQGPITLTVDKLKCSCHRKTK